MWVHHVYGQCRAPATVYFGAGHNTHLLLTLFAGDPALACANQAESFLARLRRMVMGQHHHASPQYLYRFANEAAR